MYTIYTNIDIGLGLKYTRSMTKKQTKLKITDFLISAKEIRNNFSASIDLLKEKKYFIITRFGRPKGVLVDFDLFSPRMTMSEEEWNRGFDRMWEIISKSKGDMTEQEAYNFIDEVKQEIRAEKRAIKAKAIAKGKNDD